MMRDANSSFGEVLHLERNTTKQKKLTMAEDAYVNLNLIDPATRIAGLVLMSLLIAIASGCLLFVLMYYTSPVLRAMQPLFLVMLCVGYLMLALAIIPQGMDDQTTENVDAACGATFWMSSIGVTLLLSALLAKLWRINKIFHAQNFQRKVIPLKDVLWPVIGLMCIALVIATVQTIVDPYVWRREPIDGNPYNTYGFCSYKKLSGFILDIIQELFVFVILIFLCVQSYRARDIQPQFSDARGVALALFSWLQATIVGVPIEIMLEENNTNARYMSDVLRTVSTSIAALLFIFGPIVANQRKYLQQKKDNTAGGDSILPVVHISGIPAAVDRAVKTTRSTASPVSSGGDVGLPEHQEALSRISDLEVELNAVKIRNKELEERLGK